MKILIALLSVLLVAQPATAQTQAPTQAPAQTDSQVCYDPNASDQATIDACTRFIKSGITGTTLSAGYQNRATGYIGTHQDDLALADENQAILYDPNNAQAYNNRGGIYYRKGLLSTAILDYTQAIRVKSDYANAYLNRGNAHFANGENDLAVVDYNQAIQLDPKVANYYDRRGYAFVTTGRYDAAIVDFQHSITLSPRFAYAVLWLHIARMRSGTDDKVEFEQNSANLSTTDWPAPVVNFYLGTMTADALLAKATTPGHRCEANFYYAEWLLAHKRDALARPHFQTAAKLCEVTFYEGPAARAELQRLP